MPYTGSDLTGSLVQELRTRHKLSRASFSKVAGLAGKSTARLYNIEVNDQWKPGDRERVAAVLTNLELGALPTDARVVASGGSTVHPAAVTVPTGPSIIPLSEDPDDLVDRLATILPHDAGSAATSEARAADDAVASDLLGDALLSETDGVYRVSNSELQTFKRCRRKWWLAWYRRLMLQTEDFTSVRATGTRVHRALAYWYVPDGEKRVDPRDALERVIVDDWTKVARLAQERRTSDEQLGELAVEFAQATNLERAMVEGYVQWLEETGADAELRITASETPLVVDQVVDMGGEYHHEQREIQFIGLLDVRAKRTTDNVNLLIDHKAQPLDARVLTPSGWTTMGELSVGSQVVAPDGAVTTVTGVYPQGVVPIYELAFSDKSKVRSCDDHLWNVKQWHNQALTKTMSLREIRESKSEFWLPLVDGTMPFKSELPVDPYVLGVLLGDGSLSGGGSHFSTKDHDIADEVRRRLPDKHQLTGPHGGIDYNIGTGTKWIPNVIRTYIAAEKLNVRAEDKHVPDVYLWADDKSRLDLLRGLMDTDGHVAIRGQTLFVSTSRELRDAVVHLTRSLGGVATTNEHAPRVPGKTTYVGKAAYSGRTVFTCNIQMPHDVVPFHCARKKARWVDTRKTQPSRKLSSVEYVGDYEAQCITVDHPSHCYVTDNFTVTHNTVGDLTAPVVTLPQNEQMMHYMLLEFLSLEDSDVRCDGALYNMMRRVKRSAKAKPPFYDRIEVRHNKFELESYRRRALAATREILVAIDRLERGEEHFDVVYPSPTPECRWSCDFFAVCNLFDDGSRGVNDMVNALYRSTNPLERYRKQVEK
jgi:hypothetical protein